MEGIGMIWPLAAEYARKGWAVRRAGWENPYIATGTALASNSLRWIVYQNALFHTIYQERGLDSIGARISRPVLNTDFTDADFRADDWTVLTPACLASGGAGNPDQQGFQPYPQNGTESPSVDPQYPNIYFGTCPTVPPVIANVTPGSGGNPEWPTDQPNPDSGSSESSESSESSGTQDPQPPLPAQNGGGTSGDRAPRKKPARPAAAPLSVTLVSGTPACHLGETATENVTVTVSLGAAPSPAADGVYWVTVVCNGTARRLNMSPGDGQNLSFEVTGTPGAQDIVINATAYLPVKRLTSRDSLRKVMNEGCVGFYLTLLCQSEPCHSGTGRMTVTSPAAGQIYQGCPGLGNTFIAGTLEADTDIELDYVSGPTACESHCCDNAVFGILLNRHIEGVSPDAFVNLGSVDLNNGSDCGNRSGSVTVTQANLDALAAP